VTDREKLRASLCQLGSVVAAVRPRDAAGVTCAGNNTIAALIAGAIDATAARSLEAHLDTCSTCRQLVADLGRGLSALDDDRLPRPGDRLGRYAIERALGAGGMGVVFEARDTTLDRRIAIKVVRPDTAADPHALLGEARAMAKLAHPNIAAIYDVGTVRGQLYLCMELIIGTTLREWLATPRTPRAILEAFVAAGRGLAYVHAQGLVHLDFKPDNVLIDRSDRVVVTDFGVAAMLGKSDMIAGTPAYMAPEQRRGGPTDARADQFAFCTALGDALGDAAPSWARAALERGRSPHRCDRFASMDVLLAALEAGTLRSRRRLRAVAAVAFAIGIGLVISRPPGTVTKLVERSIARPVIEHIVDDRTREATEVAPIALTAPSIGAASEAPAPVARAARSAPLASVRAIADRSITFAAGGAELLSSTRRAPGHDDAIAPMACDDGSELACATERPSCPAPTTLAVVDGCWSCVDEHSCAPHGIPHTCDDGSPLRCTVARPTCSDGLLPSVRGGCWQCADPFTCAARSVNAPIPPVLVDHCGNGTCEPNEDHVTCPIDCAAKPSNGSGNGSGTGSSFGSGTGDTHCGNGFCEIGEDHASCPADCCELVSGGSGGGGVCAPVCGNGFCEIDEDHASCPADCCLTLPNGACVP
jgi:hypothetical protein